MNSIPDRAKECLPPKKRESRQNLCEQRPPDEFKSPAPLRSRPVGARQTEPQGYSKGPLSSPHYGKVLLHAPPPAPPPDKFPMPWPLPSPTPLPFHFFPNQTGERCGSKLHSWREQCSPGTDPLDGSLHHSRWPRSEPALSLHHPAVSTPYKSHHPQDSRDMWPYCNMDKFNLKQHYSRHLPYADPHLEGRRAFMVRKHNGLDAAGGRSAPALRLPAAGNYPYDSKIKQDDSHTNGKRRYPEDHRPFSRAVAKDGRAADMPGGRCSPQDKDSCATPKTSANTLDKSAFPGLPLRAPSRENFDLAGPPGAAQIYYALGPMQASLMPSPLAPPLQSPLAQASPIPFYGLPHREPHSLRSSRLSPLVENQSLEGFPAAQYNSHRSDRGQPQPGPPCPRSASGGHRSHADPAALQSTPSPGSSLAPQPVAFLPHFTKGSLIELSGGRLRPVEQLQTEDFMLCASTSPDLHLCFCTVILITPCSTNPGFYNLQLLLADRNTQELLKVLAEYPFFVRDRGWSSCSPQRTAQLYGLSCRQLSVDDVCLALTPVPSAPASASALRASIPAPELADTTQCTNTKEGAKAGQQRPAATPPPSAGSGTLSRPRPASQACGAGSKAALLGPRAHARIQPPVSPCRV
ncbi:ataxin-1 [Brienomyrus brachyistius]|uniref:ataxin-1 n=1 Tax=Brienomyrus brachyistius TaxID=42636 RepID=UPI0020B43F2A|nr:ataxin-1 [Brienomyrus brachyistius]XP_048874472.1 ataxin-1 [Brienomyrus brachyistius]XP_048874473.1 ataxin-1 [Brienomyrus brachyistius]XP_048874474.1 ataxin-1 [Brienomyrus brachyistius]